MRIEMTSRSSDKSGHNKNSNQYDNVHNMTARSFTKPREVPFNE